MLPALAHFQTLPLKDGAKNDFTAIRAIKADLGKEHADTFHAVQHPDLRADYVLAYPPFNDADWFRKDDDVRWQFGVRSAFQQTITW